MKYNNFIHSSMIPHPSELHQEMLRSVENYLNEKKYEIISKNNLFGPDIIFKKEGNIYLIEVFPTIYGKHAKPFLDINEILINILSDKVYGGYIALEKGTLFSDKFNELLELTGIGIIRVDGKQIQIEKEFQKIPIKNNLQKINLTMDEFKKEFNDSLEKQSKENEKQKIKDFPIEIIIFVICGTLVGTSVWNIFEEIFSLGNKLIYSIIMLVIGIIPMGIFYFIRKSKIKDE